MQKCKHQRNQSDRDARPMFFNGLHGEQESLLGQQKAERTGFLILDELHLRACQFYEITIF